MHETGELHVKDGLLRAGQFAELCGVAPSTVWRWTRKGRLSFTWVGDERRYDPSDISVIRRPGTRVAIATPTGDPA